jgi:hypothetical protein
VKIWKILAIAVLAGCSQKDSNDPASGEAVVACDTKLSGSTYRSIERLECGLGPTDDSSPKCHWTFTFTEDTYRWRYSDMYAVGSYSCEKDKVSFEWNEEIGDIAGDMLIFKKNEYRRVSK